MVSLLLSYGVPLGPSRFRTLAPRAKMRKCDKQTRKHDEKNLAFSRLFIAFSPSRLSVYLLRFRIFPLAFSRLLIAFSHFRPKDESARSRKHEI